MKRDVDAAYLEIQRHYAQHTHHQQHALLLIVLKKIKKAELGFARNRFPKMGLKRPVPVPKLGPPLNARSLQRWPCITPALTSSRNKYNGSWNLSFKRWTLIAECIARASGVCMWEVSRNLARQKDKSSQTPALGMKAGSGERYRQH
jgi:hypothetical protein